MHALDRLFEKSSRSLAQRTSRRSFVAVLGQILTGHYRYYGPSF